MNTRPAPAFPLKQDRNNHEVSGDESPPAESRARRTSGGGHRSGSRGAGTLENTDDKPEPQQGPRSGRDTTPRH